MPSCRKSKAARTKKSNARAAKHHAAIAASPNPNRQVVVIEDKIDETPVTVQQRKVLIVEEQKTDVHTIVIDQVSESKNDLPIPSDDHILQLEVHPSLDIDHVVSEQEVETTVEPEDTLDVLGDLTDIE